MKKVAKLTNWKLCRDKEEIPDDRCTICLCHLHEGPVVKICNDQHFFHRDCLLLCYKKEYLQCPLCMRIYGTMVGNQPKNGEMRVLFLKPDVIPLSGYEGVGTIEILYDFPDGIQEDDHPNPGHPYAGTSRIAYLPDTEEGRRILKLLKIAFQRRLVFTIGTSVTTGASNVVVWNGIHHKTRPCGGPTYYGYPDPTYFNRVTMELAAKGVFASDLGE